MLALEGAIVTIDAMGTQKAVAQKIIDAKADYVLRTSIPWRDLPSEYGPPTTIYNRFNRWSYAGIWDQIMDAVADAHNVDMVMIDGTSIRVHHAGVSETLCMSFSPCGFDGSFIEPFWV